MKTSKILLFMLTTIVFANCSSEENDPTPVVGQELIITLSAQGTNTTETNDFEATFYYGSEQLENTKQCNKIEQIKYTVINQTLYVKVVASKPMKVTILNGSKFESYQLINNQVMKITI